MGQKPLIGLWRFASPAYQQQTAFMLESIAHLIYLKINNSATHSCQINLICQINHLANYQPCKQELRVYNYNLHQLTLQFITALPFWQTFVEEW